MGLNERYRKERILNENREWKTFERLLKER